MAALLLLFCVRLSHFHCSGVVVEKGTGQPIVGTVIVRSWKRTVATAVHPMTHGVTFAETITDQNGHFRLWSVVRLFHFSIPVFGEIEEDSPVIFRPGYRLFTPFTLPQVIELEKLPLKYATRSEELKKVHVDYFEVSDTSLLSAAIELEQAQLSSLP